MLNTRFAVLNQFRTNFWRRLPPLNQILANVAVEGRYDLFQLCYEVELLRKFRAKSLGRKYIKAADLKPFFSNNTYGRIGSKRF